MGCAIRLVERIRIDQGTVRMFLSSDETEVVTVMKWLIQRAQLLLGNNFGNDEIVVAKVNPS
jgi:hypothetical protein